MQTIPLSLWSRYVTSRPVQINRPLVDKSNEERRNNRTNALLLAPRCYLLSERENKSLYDHYLKSKYLFCFLSYRKIRYGAFFTLTFLMFLCTNVEDGCKEESCSSSNPREILFRKELINWHFSPLTPRND